MCISVEVHTIGSDCMFQFKSLQLAQNIRVSLEIVVIGSGCARSSEIVVLGLDEVYFALNSCDWHGLFS